ncbi:hypothetical protein ACS2QB_28975, partial [Bacillus cereus group sp. Bce039]|uniref:hypothetical protein n=1 Tax=Bacillus cereus group sp. Bce039 TaxID=3445230 RepID=UPI003F25D5B2
RYVKASRAWLNQPCSSRFPPSLDGFFWQTQGEEFYSYSHFTTIGFIVHQNYWFDFCWNQKF